MNTTSAPEPTRRAWVEQHMGMPVSIHLRGAGAASAASERAANAAFVTFREMDEIFSTYPRSTDRLRS